MSNNRGKWKKSPDDRGLLKRGRVWYVRFFANGKRITEPIGPSKDYARKVLAKRRTEVLDGRFFPNLIRQNVLFSEIVEDSLARAKDAFTVKYPGRKFREGNGGRIKEWFPNRTAASITPQEIAAKLHETARTPATFNRYRVAISHAYKLAIENRKCAENPAKLVRLQRESNERVRYLNQHDVEEEKKLREAIRAKYPERAAEFDLALNTGLRLSEMCRLTWQDVDLRLNVLTLRETKSGKIQRVPLNAAAKEALRNLRAQTTGVHVCPDHGDRRRRWWDEIRLDAKTVDFHWHDLRHTFASRLVMAGVDILTVNKLLRHATLGVTMRYAHLAPNHLHDAVARLDRSVQKVYSGETRVPAMIQ